MSEANKAISNERTLAMVLLIREIADQIDEIARLKALGHNASISTGMLHEMCSVIHELDPDLRALYFELLPKLTGKAASPRRPQPKDEATEELLIGPRRRLIMRLKGDLGLKVA